MNPSTTTLLDLPLEMIEKIVSHLDFVDLKFLSLTCHTLNNISWKYLSRCSYIKFSNILNSYELKMFEHSERTYENIQINYWYSQIDCFEELLNQIQALQSIKLKRFSLDWSNMRSKPLSELIKNMIQRNADLKDVCFNIEIITEKINIDEDLEKQISTLPNINFTLNIQFSSWNFKDSLKLERIYLIHNKPEAALYQEVILDRQIRSANNLKISFSTEKNKIIVLGSENIEFLPHLIQNNLNSLTDLTLTECDSGNFEIPSSCQLKRLEITGGNLKLLKNQTSLREVSLSDINNDGLDFLANNKLLSTVFLNFNGVRFIDETKLGFLRSVRELSLTSTYFSKIVLTAILENLDPDKVYSLDFTYHLGFEILENDTAPIKTFNNLRNLKIFGTTACEYFSRKVEAPNLEVCTMNISPNLFGFRKLRVLSIDNVCLTFDRLVEILEDFPFLQRISIQVDWKDFVKTFKYILQNVRNIAHFDLCLCYANQKLDKDEITKYILKSLGIIWSKFGNLYKTQNFSFEIKY